MEDLEILPKRRKLDPSLIEQTNGHNVENTSPLDIANKAQEAKSDNETNHKKIKWNFKLVRPEVLKCCRRIVEGLNGAESAEKKINFPNETMQQNGVVNLREKEMESTLAPKRKLNPEVIKEVVDKKTASPACAVATNCSVVVKTSRVNSVPSREKNNEHIVNGQEPTQQHSTENLISSTPAKERVRNEIRKIICDHTREAMAKAESLKFRITTLESENRRLKDKVATLYSALKKLRGRKKHKEVLPKITNNPKVKPNGAYLQPKPVPEAAIKDKAKETFQALKKTIATTTTNPLHSRREALDKTSSPLAVSFKPRTRAPYQTTTHSVNNKITYDQTTRSIATGSQKPILPLGKEEALPSVHLPHQHPTVSTIPVKDAFGRSEKKAVDNRDFSSVSAPQHKVTTPNGYTSKTTESPVSLLCQVLDEILASSKNDLAGDYALNQQSSLEVFKVSVNEPLPHTAKEIPLPRTIPDESEKVLHKQSSLFPLKPMTAVNILNKPNENYCQRDKNTSLAQHRAEHQSPNTVDNNNNLDGETGEAKGKHRESLGKSCDLNNNGKEQRSPLTQEETSQYRPHAETQSPHSVVLSNGKVPAVVSSSPASSISQPAKSIPVTSSGCPSELESPGQSIGLLDGIDMLAQAAGLKNASTDSGLRPVSNKNSTPQLVRITPIKIIKIPNPSLSQHDLNAHAVDKANTPLKRTLEPSKSQSSPGHARIVISPPYELQRHKLAHENQVSTNGSLKSDCTGVVLKQIDMHNEKPVNGYRDSINAELAKPHLKVHDHEKRPTSHSKEDNSTLVAEGLSNCDSRLAAAPPKIQTVWYHANSDPRFNNNQEYQEHTRKQPENTACVRNHDYSKPRYLPYPPIRPKAQQPPFLSVSPNIQYVTKMNERKSPKPGMPRTASPLRVEGQFAQNSQCSTLPSWPQIKENSTKTSNGELPYQPSRISPETSSTKVRLISPSSDNTNTLSNYNKETLLLQLLPSDRAPYIPRSYSAPTFSSGSSRANPGFSKTMNAVHLPINSFETNKRYIYLPPKTHVQNGMPNLKESSTCNNGKTNNEGIPFSIKPPPLSAGESHREGSKQSYVCSDNSGSIQINPAVKPQIELSQSCQRYLTQLKKSPLQFIPKENSTCSTTELKPQSESRPIDRNNGSKQSSKLPILQSSIERMASRRQEGHDVEQVNSKALTTQSINENSHLPDSQSPNRILYHHRKFTNPPQEQRGQTQSSYYHVKPCSPHHVVLTEKPFIRPPASTATNGKA